MLGEEKIRELEKFATRIRIEILTQMIELGEGHIGGCMSIADVLAVLYGDVLKVRPEEPTWEDRDKLVISKGHAGPAQYAALALRGFFPMEWLKTLNQLGTRLPSHCDCQKTPGIDMSAGSLGLASAAAVGFAYAARLDGRDSYTYLITGDGESQEGQIWEAAMFAGFHKLNHLITFVDHNKKQVDGEVKEILDMGDFAQKYEAFGYFAQTIDGHDVAEIHQAIEEAKMQEKPAVIILETVKGKGCYAEPYPDNHIMGIDPALAIPCKQQLIASLGE